MSTVTHCRRDVCGEKRRYDEKILLRVNNIVEIPHISDENAKEDPEVRVTVKDDVGLFRKRLKETMAREGRARAAAEEQRGTCSSLFSAPEVVTRWC